MIAEVVFLAAYAGADPPPGSSELATRLVPCAELDHLRTLRCRHRHPVGSGRDGGRAIWSGTGTTSSFSPYHCCGPSAAPADPAVVGAEPSRHDEAPGRVGIDVAGGASLLAFCAALAVLDAERSSPDANISDFGDPAWWAVTTMTTVGYGDHYPVTAAGRLVAFGLMIGGIALLGTVTATLASWLVETVAAEKEQAEDLQIMVRRLEDKIDRLAAESQRGLARVDRARIPLAFLSSARDGEGSRCQARCSARD